MMNSRSIKLIIATGLIFILFASYAGAADTAMTEAAKKRRDKLFKLTADKLNFAPSQELPNVWGLVMETALPETVVTLYVSLNGNANIYFGAGGKIASAGQDLAVRTASERLLLGAEEFRGEFQPVKEFPLPGPGQVKFYLFTYSGVLAAEAGETELKEDTHPLSPLYFLADNVITQIRVVTQRNQATG